MKIYFTIKLTNLFCITNVTTFYITLVKLPICLTPGKVTIALQCVDCSRRRLEGKGQEPYTVPSLPLAARPAGAHPMLAQELAGQEP